MIENKADSTDEIRRCYAQTILIYSAQGVFILALAIIGWFVVPASPTTFDGAPLTSLWVLILFIAVGALVIRRVLTRWERLRDVKLLRGTSGLLGTLRTNSIILVALAEAVMIAGFLSAFYGGDRADLIRALVIAATVFAICFPRRAVWDTIVAGLEGI